MSYTTIYFVMKACDCDDFMFIPEFFVMNACHCDDFMVIPEFFVMKACHCDDFMVIPEFLFSRHFFVLVWERNFYGARCLSNKRDKDKRNFMMIWNDAKCLANNREIRTIERNLARG